MMVNNIMLKMSIQYMVLGVEPTLCRTRPRLQPNNDVRRSRVLIPFQLNLDFSATVSVDIYEAIAKSQPRYRPLIFQLGRAWGSASHKI